MQPTRREPAVPTRVLRHFLTDRVQRHAMSFLVGALTYVILVARAIPDQNTPATVPSLSVAIACMLPVVAAILIIYALHNAAEWSRTGRLMRWLTDECVALVQTTHPPHRDDGQQHAPAARPASTTSATPPTPTATSSAGADSARGSRYRSSSRGGCGAGSPSAHGASDSRPTPKNAWPGSPNSSAPRSPAPRAGRRPLPARGDLVGDVVGDVVQIGIALPVRRVAPVPGPIRDEASRLRRPASAGEATEPGTAAAPMPGCKPGHRYWS
jgi:hypothetical protein